ncbi:hypothetical protein Tco_1081751 [Tanacetum coccineum]|uniref:Uncharacterized protein n=1 Tax=Tanacetum coccineum TaxID=301880 RepID=A0ABQ5HZL4_9ASTR
MMLMMDDEEPSGQEDDEEEEEHLAPADPSVIPAVDPVPSAGDTEAFETDESAPTPRPPQIRIPFAQTRLRRARKSVRPEPPMSASMEARIAKHAAAPTPPLPVVPSPLPLPSPLTTSPTDEGAPLGYRAAGIRMRAAVASPPSLLPPTSPSYAIFTTTDIINGLASDRLERMFETLGLAMLINPLSNIKAMMTTEYCPQLKSKDGARALLRHIGSEIAIKEREDHQEQHHQQQNRRQEAAKVYVAAPAKGRGYAGNLPWCNRYEVRGDRALVRGTVTVRGVSTRLVTRDRFR